MSPIEPHHIRIGPEQVAGNGGLGRVFFVPGSSARTEALAEHFTDVQCFPSPRRLDAFIGRYSSGGVSIDVGACPTGMGCPSLGIIVTELLALGVRRLMRVGSAGSLQPGLGSGDLVIASGGVRDEAASDAYCSRDIPALAHPDWIRSLELSAARHGFGERTYTGLVHTKDSLYGREFSLGPRRVQNQEYMDELRQMGVLCSEMESSHLFILAAAHRCQPRSLAQGQRGPDLVKAGSLLAVVGDEGVFDPDHKSRPVEEQAIRVALDAAVELLALETKSSGVG
jgi:uridine phosphorylase